MSSFIPERIGRYEVVEPLGSGGMGVVYLATDPLLRRTVAVKVLSSENEDLRERFAREARSAASLRHNNIVTIYDVGEDNGQPYIAMEFLDGESMAEMIRRRAPLPLARRLQLIIELCTGLGYAHRNGIIHRDIKPANLMITSEGGLKILDFGLARVVAEPTLGGLTQVGTLLGTSHYLSPEQIRGKTADQASDIFAVGLVLYELLAYQKAFPGDSPPVILLDIVEREPTPIRQFVPDIDEELEDVVKQAVEKDHDRRYPNLGLLAEALETIRRRTARPAEDSTLSRRARRKAGAGHGIGTDAAPATDDSDQRLGAIALKRAAHIEQHLVAAAEQLQSGQFDAALEHCEHALMLDPENDRALDTLRQAHHAKEEAQVQSWIEEARAQLQRGAVTEAEALIEQSLRVRANQPDALALQKDLRERRRERERKAERQRSAQAAMERASRNIEEGALDAAIRSASEALAHDPDHAGARELRARAVAMVEERQRQQHEEAAREIAAREEQRKEQERQAREEAERRSREQKDRLANEKPRRQKRTQERRRAREADEPRRPEQDQRLRQEEADRLRLAEEERLRLARQGEEENAKSRADEDRGRAEPAAIEPVNMDAGEVPAPAASESAPTSDRQPAGDSTSGPDQAVPPQPVTIQRNTNLLGVVAVAVLLAVSVAAWLTSSRPEPAPTPATPDAQAAKPADDTGQLLAQQNAERYRGFLAQADERLAAQDPEGALAAIQEAEKILAGDSRVEELKKQVESARAAALQREQQRADAERALDEAAKMTSDNDAIARLQRELGKYPGHAAMTAAVGARTKARDSKIADLVRFAQRAPDAQAVTLLQEALTHDSSRRDVRRELERRRASLVAASKPPAPPPTREEIENDVRSALFAYQSAYASRSADAFLKIAPFWTRAQIEAEFNSFRTIQLNIEGINISLDESGTRAVVTCTISSVKVPADPGNSRPVTEKRAWQFQLANIGGAWQITSAPR
jgi:serine/threonine protein kinase